MIHKAQADAEHAQSGNPGQCVPCGADIHRVPGGSGPVWVHTRTGMVAERDTPTTSADVAPGAFAAAVDACTALHDAAHQAGRKDERERIIGQDRESLNLLLASVEGMHEAGMVVGPNVQACAGVIRRLLEQESAVTQDWVCAPCGVTFTAVTAAEIQLHMDAHKPGLENDLRLIRKHSQGED